MFLKKENNSIFRTVKFQVALWYVMLFSFSSLLFFSIIYVFLYVNVTRQVDERLITVSEKIEDFYLKGESYEDNELLAPNVHIPENIIAIAENAVKNLVVVHSETVMVDNKLLYEITGVSSDIIYEVKIDQNEKVLEIETKVKNELEFLEKGFVAESLREGTKTIFICLISPDGRILANSDLSRWPGLRFNRHFIEGVENETGKFRTVTVSGVSNKVRICDRRIFDGNILEVGIRLSYEEKLLKTYSNIFISVFLSSLFFGSAVGWFVSKKSMAGVDRVSEAALNIGQGNFSGQVPYGNEGEEIRNLVSAFNDMINKIRFLITQLSEVTDNIAHDLRTPITRIRGTIETTVGGDPSIENYREMAGEVVEECDRLVGMINTMLDITAVDSGMLVLSKTDVVANELLTRAYSLFSPLAEMKDIEFILDLPPEPITISCNIPYLQRVVANLLDNAIKYTPEKGKILLSLSSDDNNISIIVRDTGCGIGTDDQKHIFDRFYRADDSRSLPGNGLGLSLALAIVKAHNGTITVESSQSTGSIFTVKLPK